MKKVLALAIIFAMMFALAIPAGAAVANPVAITANNFTPTINGVLDVEYAGPFNIAAPMLDEDGQVNTNPNAAKGQVWAAWDAGAVYYFIEVTGTTPFQDADFNWECVEIFMDWNNGQHESDDGTDATPFWQIRVSPVDPESLGGYSRAGSGNEWSTAAFEDLIEFVLLPRNGSFNNGYIIEMKISAPDVAGALTQGRMIVTDFQVCDSSDGSERDGQMFLGHIGPGFDDNSRWNTGEYLTGRLTLEGPYVAPAAEEPEPDEPAADAGAGDGGAGGDAGAGATVARTPSPRTNDAGIIALIVLLTIAALGIVVLRRKAVRL